GGGGPSAPALPPGRPPHVPPPPGWGNCGRTAGGGVRGGRCSRGGFPYAYGYTYAYACPCPCSCPCSSPATDGQNVDVGRAAVANVTKGSLGDPFVDFGGGGAASGTLCRPARAVGRRGVRGPRHI